MFVDYLPEGWAYTQGVIIKISRAKWRALGRAEKLALLLHEGRHVWQNVWSVLGALLIIPLLLAVMGVEERSGVVLLVAALVARWWYVGLRSWNNGAYAEYDAVKFSFRFCRRGTLSLMKKSGLEGTGEVVEVYRRAIAWLQRRL